MVVSDIFETGLIYILLGLFDSIDLTCCEIQGVLVQIFLCASNEEFPVGKILPLFRRPVSTLSCLIFKPIIIPVNVLKTSIW